MKKTLLFLAICCCMTAGLYAQNMENTKITVGADAPDLTFTDPNGATLKLSEIIGKRLVLVDFWASWCRPCRGANPRLVALYDKYKEMKFKAAKKGFTIVSVSLDQTKDAWVKAIADDKLAWPYHMSDLGGWGSEPAAVYGVQFIPQAFLIGPDGKVIGKYMFAEAAEDDIKKFAAIKKKKKFLFF